VRHTAVLWLFVIAMLATTELGKASEDGSTGTLAGISGVYVDVLVPAQPDAEKVFLKDVESKLQAAGIRRMPNTEPKDLSEAAHAIVEGSLLGVTVLTAPPSRLDEPAAFFVHVEVRQGVTLTRDPSLGGVATTWRTERVGFGKIEKARDTVKDALDDFIVSWKSANSRK
jgi:hypothetical protein